MPIILIQPDIKGAKEFKELLSINMKGFDIVSAFDKNQIQEIEVVVIWRSVPNFVTELPNLKMVLVCGSGVDHIIDSPNLSKEIPLIRLVDPYLKERVSDYVINEITRHLNHLKSRSQSVLSLQKFKRKSIGIGIMGLGLMGSYTAEKLSRLGFEVFGWVNSNKLRSIEKVFVGVQEIPEFAKRCGIIVCQLPLTKATRGILDINLFNMLPHGAYLINVGRGEHLNEADLLTALDSGRLDGACLDVLEKEPAPADHPFVLNPKIKLTPHIAGYVGADTQAPYAIKVINDFYENREVKGIVDFSLNY